MFEKTKNKRKEAGGSPNFRNFFWLLWKQLLSQNCHSHPFWATFWKFWATFYFNLWSHWMWAKVYPKSSFPPSLVSWWPSSPTLAPVWPDLPKFRHFCEILKVFGHFSGFIEHFGQKFETTLANFDSDGQDLIVENGQILKNNLAIWSHWLAHKSGSPQGGPLSNF